MKRRSVQVGLAIVLALIATVAVYSYVKRADQRAVAGARAVTVQRVVALIPAGTKVKDVRDGQYLQAEKLPADSVPADALQSIGATMLSQVAVADIAPGQLLVPQMFGSQLPKTSGLAIPKGMLAVSVQVSTAADVAGYVQPGAEVAIFDTFIMDSKGHVTSGTDNAFGNWTTKLLLPRVSVLAVSSTAPSGTTDGLKSGVSSDLMVTVAVDEVAAQRLIHVANKGTLYLALLSATSVVAPGPGVDNNGTQLPVFPDWSRSR